MKKSEVLPLPLAEMTAYCERKGYEALPVKEGELYRFLIFKDNALVKIGQTTYENWHEGEKEVYAKLFKAIKVC